MSKVAEASVEDVKLEDKTGIYVYKKQITDLDLLPEFLMDSYRAEWFTWL